MYLINKVFTDLLYTRLVHAELGHTLLNMPSILQASDVRNMSIKPSPSDSQKLNLFDALTAFSSCFNQPRVTICAM